MKKIIEEYKKEIKELYRLEQHLIKIIADTNDSILQESGKTKEVYVTKDLIK